MTSDVLGIVPQCLLHLKRIVLDQRMTSDVLGIVLQCLLHIERIVLD